MVPYILTKTLKAGTPTALTNVKFDVTVTDGKASFPINGKIAANGVPKNLAPGPYKDTVNLTITY